MRCWQIKWHHKGIDDFASLIMLQTTPDSMLLTLFETPKLTLFLFIKEHGHTLAHNSNNAAELEQPGVDYHLPSGAIKILIITLFATATGIKAQ